MKNLLYLILFLSLPVLSQQRQPLQGKIVTGDMAVYGVFVINKNTGAEVKTDATGSFTIDVRDGDKLAVYSTNISPREFAINAQTFLEVPYVMEVTLNATELKEVVINNVSSESLGIVPKGQKRYTPAERRLRAASDWDPTIGLGTMAGVGVSLDPLFNMISGRTKMLKRDLASERKEFDIKKINGIYTEDQIINELKIPEEYVEGFLFYAVEDAQCSAALKGKNNELAKLQMMVLAEKYIKLIADR